MSLFPGLDQIPGIGQGLQALQGIGQGLENIGQGLSQLGSQFNQALQGAHHKHHKGHHDCDPCQQGVNFNQAAGADGQMNYQEFANMANQQGITNPQQIQQVFNQADTNHDGQISQQEFNNAFGGSDLSTPQFQSGFNNQLQQAQNSACPAAGADQCQPHHHHHHHMLAMGGLPA